MAFVCGRAAVDMCAGADRVGANACFWQKTKNMEKKMSKQLIKEMLFATLAFVLVVATTLGFAGCGAGKVSELKITGDPIKTAYYAGDYFDTAGLAITATYGNGDKELVHFDATGEDGYTYDLYMVSLRTEHTKVTFSYKGKEVSVNITVSKRVASAPSISSVHYTALDSQIFVQPIDGAEYKLGAGAWQDSNVFGALTNGMTYDLSVRFKESDLFEQSEAITIPNIQVLCSQAAISASDIHATKTESSITIEPITGAEYKIGNGDWTTSNVFDELEANTAYTISVRMARDDYKLASEPTTITVTTLETTLSEGE